MLKLQNNELKIRKGFLLSILIGTLVGLFTGFLLFGGHNVPIQAQKPVETPRIVLTSQTHSEAVTVGEKLQHSVGINKYQPTVRYDQTELYGEIR